MNKRDFYKELMSEYMFDKEKICANAKKGRFAGRKAFPMYIGMTAAVAAVVVVAGTVIASNLVKPPVAELVPPLAGMPDDKRIEIALAAMIKNRNSMEEQDHFVTFTKSVSPAMARGVLSEPSGSMDVLGLLMADGTRVSGVNEIGTVFKNNSGEVSSAVIRCTGYVAARINENGYVFLVEDFTPEDWNDWQNGILSPVSVDEKDLPVVSLPTESEPTVDNNSNTNVPGVGNTHMPSDIDAPNHDNETSDTDNSQTSEPNNSGTSETTSSTPETSEPTSGGSETSSAPQTTSSDVTPPQPTNKLPEGVKLPVKAVKPSYISDDIGAQRAYFLSEDVFYVKTENSVKLYKWSGWEKETIALIAEKEIADAKVMWVSSNGLRLMVSGVENGERRRLYIVDAKSGTINDMQIDEMLGDEGTIAEAAYNEYSDLFVLNVLDSGSKYIFTANLSGYRPVNKEIVAYGSEQMSVLAANGSSVYYSELKNGVSVICKSENDENTAVITANELLLSMANPALTHAVMFGASGTFIFDPETESLIEVNNVDNISFGASAHSFSDGSNYFAVSSGAIVPEERLAEIAKVDFTRSFSSEYAAVVSNGSVRIVPSIYTKNILGGKLTFDVPDENASKAQREALNLGIGVINAIASGKCKECGITTAEELTAVVERCFGKAAAELISTCKIAESGKLSYTSGSLTQISVADTVLVTDSETSGRLYVKLGTFEGKTGYLVKNITFADEGVLKLGTVI